MSIHEHLTTFHGLPVRGPGDPGAPPSDQAAWGISGDSFEESEPSFQSVLDEALAQLDPGRVRALVIGYWGPGWEDVTSSVAVSALTGAASRLTALEAIFLGDITSEESEISWIEHGDITPLLESFPRLRRLEVRGGSGLVLRPVRHTALEVLRFESGGLPGRVVRAVGESDLPALRTLEMWLGEENYGGDSRPEDWAGILAGAGLPALVDLGLQDSQIQDDVAAAVAAAPIVARLEELDLSMGILTDVGAEALLSGQPLTHLRRLDLSHHYISASMRKRLRAALDGVEVDLDDSQDRGDDDGWRYIAVSE
ncbi:STM4015 family protein [Nonomuraea typhae]|uniref:STM4015 family protein n=1 Tax=Nonomuraea typhae TaxID=2603600 RepID=A0ABW7Z3S3_9ACTN